jgi:hypothetical protein
MLVLNFTTGEFIECDKESLNFRLKLLYPHIPSLTEMFAEADLNGTYEFGYARWLISDRVVYVPEHCEDYVRKTYYEIF